MRTLKHWRAGLIPLFLCTGIATAQSPQRLKDIFVRGAGRQAVSGRESNFIAYLKSQLPPGTKAEIDNMGNLVVPVGDGAPELLVVTSVDEPGFLVTDITDDGFLRVASPGGRTPSTLFAQFHEGHYVDIAAKGGTIRGVVALPSSHLVRGRRENLTVDRMLIDIGARSRNEALARGIEILNPLSAVKDIAILAENRVAGPMLSRKFGACALLEACAGYKPKAGKGVVFAWATQGALTNSGVARLARRFTAKQVVVLGAYQRAGTRGGKDPIEILDSGVLVPDSDSPGAASPLLRSALAASGQRVKTAPSPTAALPEMRAFGPGTDLFAIAVPVLYPASLVETIDLDDLQQLVEFLKIILEL